ncbi:MAG: hypothetical protein KAH23_06250 [Kiritimatiellae bacterium]|nr:hypothetical protein [Kiritimatiellia bacterium]
MVDITKDKARDAGLAVVLVLLIIMHFRHSTELLPVAIAALVLTMVCPQFFKWFAYLWFGLAHVLGTVMSKLLLTLVFFVVVTPVAVVRRMMGKDAMKIGMWKTAGDVSAFSVENRKYLYRDIEKPY